MRKSTKMLLIGIATMSILSGFYALYSKREMFDVFLGIFIGLSLLGSIYYDEKEPKD